MDKERFLNRLIELMDVDAVLIQPSFELEFLMGFSPMLCERFQGLFIKKTGDMFYLCEELYVDELENAYKGKVPIYHYHDNEGMEKVYEILKENDLWNKTIGVNTSAQAFNVADIAHQCHIDFVNAKPLLEEIRILKTSEELDCLRKSAKIADAAFEVACKTIRPGIGEFEVAEAMRLEMERLGGVECEFIVASGPNSSFPHYMDKSRIIQEGDCIVLDWGCRYQGLLSDTSRTVFVGSVTEKQKEMYELVNAAQLKSQSLVKEGAYIPDIDQTSREVLGEYAKTLTTRVGHGIGYSVHEGPYINQLNKRHLEKGMAFSIEPGVYFANDYGIRIENICIVNEQGEGEVLNQSDRSLRVIDWYKKENLG